MKVEKNDGVPGGGWEKTFREEVELRNGLPALDPLHENQETLIKSDGLGGLLIEVPQDGKDYPIQPGDAATNHLAWLARTNPPDIPG